VTSFPALLSRVLDDVRSDTLLSSPASYTNGTNGSAIEVRKPNGTSSDDKPNLALPQSVLEEALKVTRESLEEVCEIEPDKT
jgi:DNA polymerase III sliding clamp (beta) subunit (PCNA family)